MMEWIWILERHVEAYFFRDLVEAIRMNSNEIYIKETCHWINAM